MNKTQIIDLLKQEILELQLLPGGKLSEAMMTERFGLSRTPIRDILKTLEKEDYIHILPQKGSFVSAIDLNSVEQIIYMRTALERQIYMDLHQQLTVNMIHELTTLLNKQKESIQQNDYRSFIIYDDAFHKSLYDYCGRSFIWDLLKQFNVHYLRYRKLHMKTEGKLSTLLDEHKQLFEFLKGRDSLSLEELLHQHLRIDEVNLEILSQYNFEYTSNNEKSH